MKIKVFASHKADLQYQIVLQALTEVTSEVTYGNNPRGLLDVTQTSILKSTKIDISRDSHVQSHNVISSFWKFRKEIFLLCYGNGPAGDKLGNCSKGILGRPDGTGNQTSVSQMQGMCSSPSLSHLPDPS